MKQHLEEFADVVESASSSPSGSRLISRILPPAVRLWLLSQVDRVEDLTFRIEGRDRELLAGNIPGVSLSAQKAVYQGIHLSQIAVTAQAIRVNLGQVIRRQPLRLLAPFPISGDLRLTTADLNQSLQAPLLGAGLYDFLQRLAQSQPEAAHLVTVLDELPDRTVASHYHTTAAIEADGITLRLTPYADTSVPPIAIATQLTVKDGHRLCLENPHWLSEHTDTETATPLPDLHGFEIDLGNNVSLTRCTLQPDEISLAGTVQVLPE